MESEILTTRTYLSESDHHSPSSSYSAMLSVERKLEPANDGTDYELEQLREIVKAEKKQIQLLVDELDSFKSTQNSPPGSRSRSMELEQLQELVKAQKRQIQFLTDELQKEREAASFAANMTMEMIQRLNYEKAAMEQEVRQSKQLAELAVHHKEQLDGLEKEPGIKDRKIADLEAKVKAYRECMKRHGIEPDVESEYESEGRSSIVETDDGGVDATAIRAEMAKSNGPEFPFFGVFEVL